MEKLRLRYLRLQLSRRLADAAGRDTEFHAVGDDGLALCGMQPLGAWSTYESAWPTCPECLRLQEGIDRDA